MAIERQVHALHAGPTPPEAIHEPHVEVPGTDGAPMPMGRRLADWADHAICGTEREFVRLTERIERLRAEGCAAAQRPRGRARGEQKSVADCVRWPAEF